MGTRCSLLSVKCPECEVATHMCQVSLLPLTPSWRTQGHLQFTLIIFYNKQGWSFFYVHGSMHHESMSIIVQRMRLYTVYYISVNCSLYMFWVVNPPIIRSTYNCNHSIWHWSNRLCYLPLSWSSWNYSAVVPTTPRQQKVAETVWPVPDAVITGICAPDDGWSYHLKHVEWAVLEI